MLLLIPLLWSLLTQSVFSATAATTAVANDDQVALQLLQLVNAARMQANIRPLCHSHKLTLAAAAQSAYQSSVNTMTHDGPVSLGDRFLRQGYQPQAVAENVGFTSTPFAQVVFDIWMGSPEHRRNILDPQYVHFGAASSQGSSGLYYWTQLFASPMNLQLEGCDFSAAANAAQFGGPGMNFNPNDGTGAGAYGSTYNAYNPAMNPNANCVMIDNGVGGRSLSCKMAGTGVMAAGNGNGLPGPIGNGVGIGYNNGVGPIGPAGINPISNGVGPVGPNAYNPPGTVGPYNPPGNTYNPPGYNPPGTLGPYNPPGFNTPASPDLKGCQVISTSPAPDGQGSVRVLSCAPGPAFGGPVVGTNGRLGPGPVGTAPGNGAAFGGVYTPGQTPIIIGPDNGPNGIGLTSSPGPLGVGQVGPYNPPGQVGPYNPPGYNPPGVGLNNPPGYNPPGVGYNNPVGYNPPGYNPPVTAGPYNPPGYNPPGQSSFWNPPGVGVN